MWILPKTTKLLTIYNTLETLEALALQDSITLKSVRVGKNDYDLDGVQVRVAPIVVDKIFMVTFDINRTRITIPAFYDVLVVVEGVYQWLPIVKLGTESVFMVSNHVFSSLSISAIVYESRENVSCYQLELSEKKPLFVGDYVLNVGNRSYTAVAVRMRELEK